MRKIILYALVCMAACKGAHSPKESVAGKWKLHKIEESDPKKAVADTLVGFVMVGSVLDKENIVLALDENGTGTFGDKKLNWKSNRDTLFVADSGKTMSFTILKLSGSVLILKYNKEGESQVEIFKKI